MQTQIRLLLEEQSLGAVWSGSSLFAILGQNILWFGLFVWILGSLQQSFLASENLGTLRYYLNRGWGSCFFLLSINHHYLSRIMRKPTICICETETQISFAVTTKLISAFVFATRIVQYLYYLNPKFQASSHHQWLYSLVCVRPGQNPHCWFSHVAAHFVSVQRSLLFLWVLRTGCIVLLWHSLGFPNKLSPMFLTSCKHAHEIYCKFWRL